jgi:hypothetical protein
MLSKKTLLEHKYKFLLVAIYQANASRCFCREAETGRMRAISQSNKDREFLSCRL